MSHDLEVFIHTLNTIQTNQNNTSNKDKHQLLADYLFHGNGWTVLTQIFYKKLKVISTTIVKFIIN